jgi:hypothetical protein
VGAVLFELSKREAAATWVVADVASRRCSWIGLKTAMLPALSTASTVPTCLTLPLSTIAAPLCFLPAFVELHALQLDLCLDLFDAKNPHDVA